MRTSLTRALCTMALLFLAASPVLAQTGSISGTVVDNETGDPLPGVNVFLEDTQQGASTNAEGRYSIEGVEPGDYQLVARFVGFRRYRGNVTIAAGEEVTENIELRQDRIGLDEIVVTGQGAGIEKKRLSTTVETITPEQIEAVPAARLEDVIQANLPNSQVRFSSGQPGTASLIRSRGVTSANLSTTPVVYVDGVRVDNLNTAAELGLGTGGAQSSAIADIPIENIERIEFVKGGAATTIYGSDAANGVLQIFTKEGVPGRNHLNFETRLGAVVGTTDFLRFEETADVFYRPGFTQSYRLSGNGGADQFQYSFSGRMLDDNGFRANNEEVRYDLRTTVGAQVTPITRYNGSFGFVSSSFTRDYNANSSFGEFGNLETGDLGFLPELSDEEIGEVEAGLDRLAGLVDITYDVKRFQTSQLLEFNPLPGLTTKLTGGIDYRTSVEQNVQTNAYLIEQGAIPGGTTDQGSISRSERRLLSLTFEANAQHSVDVGDFSFVTTALGQVFRDEDDQLLAEADNVVEGSRSLNNAAEQLSEDFELTVANYGFYLGENIGFKDRLFLEFGGRVDGNSAFGEEFGLEFYPKLGLAYTLTEEPFFRPLVPETILSTLKLRGSYGVAGNFPTPFSNDRTFAASPYNNLTTLRPDQPGNLDLGPERVVTYEGGIDLGLLNDRVLLDATYYESTTNDAIFTAPFAPSTGQNSQARNIGEIVNRGFELSSNFYVISQRDLTLNLSASINTLENEVTDNGGAPEFNVGGFLFLGTFVDEGQPVGYLRGNRVTFDEDGLIATDGEGNLLIEPNAALGSPLPDVFGTFGLNFRYKAFSLYATADYQQGAQGVNTDEVLRYFGETARIAGDLADGELDEPAVKITEGLIPAASLVEAARGTSGYNFFNFASAFVEDADYLKVRQITAGYDIAGRLLPGLLRSAKVQFAISNPFNFATSNFDPEITGSGAPGQNEVNVGGFGYGTESPPRRYTFTLNVGF